MHFMQRMLAALKLCSAKVANVPVLQPMEIPADLRRIIETTSSSSTST
jgi:hypothetical protein